jgi:sulfate transport system permease protein
LPGYGLTVGYTVLYVSLLVVLPLSTMFFKTATLHWNVIWSDISDPEVVAAYKLTFGTSLAAAAVNLVFGLLVAWVLTRYKFPFRRIIDGLVDLPFALPTAVAGITITLLYGEQPDIKGQWIGQFLGPDSWVGTHLVHGGLKIDYAPAGIVVALIFIGLPFVVRTVQPVILELDLQVEEAAASLGASRLQTFTKIIFPTIWPALLTGFALAFARSIGEYGSVVFISGNIPLRTEIVPVAIMSKLDNFDYPGATSIAIVMLIVSFIMLFVINFMQIRFARKFGQN